MNKFEAIENAVVFLLKTFAGKHPASIDVAEEAVAHLANFVEAKLESIKPPAPVVPAPVEPAPQVVPGA